MCACAANVAIVGKTQGPSLRSDDSRCRNEKPRPEGEAEAVGHFAAALTRDALPGSESESELLRNFHRLDHHELPHRALIQELDSSRDLGKQSIVLAAANVQSRLNARAALPHDDRAARHDLPAKCLKSKPLRVRVAPVS